MPGTIGNLVADSSTSTGLKWATAGKVLQVVSATTGTATTVASTTYADSSLSVSITPSSASSKVLIMVSQPVFASRSGADVGIAVRLMRDSTEIYETGGSDKIMYSYENTGGASSFTATTGALIYLDSPSTTSATTYKTQIAVSNANNSGAAIAQRDGADASIVAIEIGA